MDDRDLELVVMLRDEFLNDPDEMLPSIVEAIPHIVDGTEQAVSTIMSGLHNLKGNAQTVGFSQLVVYFHQFEEFVSSRDWSEVDRSDLDRFAMCCSRLVNTMVDHFDSLKGANTEDDGRSHIIEDELSEFRTFASELSAKPASDGSWGMESADNAEVESEPTPQQEEISASPPAPVAAPVKIPGLHLFDEEDDEPEEAASASSVEQDPEANAMADVQESPPAKEPSSSHPLPSIDESSKVSKPVGDKQYLVCQQGEQNYAVDVQLVREIIEDQRVQALPVKREGIEGVIAVRGTMIPLLDLTGFIGARSGNQPSTVICEYSNKTAGFRVDRTNQVMTIAASSLQDAASAANPAERKLIKQVAQINDESILVLDLESLLA